MTPGFVITTDIVIITGEKKTEVRQFAGRGDGHTLFKIVGFWLISDLIHIDVKLCLPV